ncbi:SDR family NAD(P)-dependent oxidoreductase [Thermomonospora umbrina]|uniref:3-oxoacyl-[acyl-carrier protein] reductase n=1 Tax=Thermomonospora umbrina TaxID=111806 RepID=A0A3D9SNP7_9ACTN|nr:SDR family oxidoreductase [Thermomonospora umbrina]REE97582.1 3-oxoacyl-[acyl-carrier protein] reductase [Thermomonospora umbrina]
MELGLQGKRVLVTGGTRGIGRAIVLGFAREGAQVYTCYRAGTEAAETLAEELSAIEAPHRIDRANVSVPKEAREMVAEAAKFLGGIDVLVNNAAMVSRGLLADTTTEKWRQVLGLNIDAIYEVTRAALPVLAPGANVIAISSGVATRGMAGRTAYATSKAALIGFVRSLSRELGPQGSRVNAVAPGVIETEARVPDAARERYSRMTALGRLGTPDDVAGVVLFLASDLAGYVTGQTILADGGI